MEQGSRQTTNRLGVYTEALALGTHADLVAPLRDTTSTKQLTPGQTGIFGQEQTASCAASSETEAGVNTLSQLAPGKARRHALTITSRCGSVELSQLEVVAAETVLARLVARAYAADHPELFGPRLAETLASYTEARK